MGGRKRVGRVDKSGEGGTERKESERTYRKRARKEGGGTRREGRRGKE